MAKVRSPNYPNIPLGAALEALRPAFIRASQQDVP